MSGSDGPVGGGTWGGGDGGDGGDDCSALRITETVAGPDPSFTFTVGRILDLYLNPGPPATIELQGLGGARVGAIHPLPSLMRCLAAGVPFQAEVLSAIGGDVRVKVEATL